MSNTTLALVLTSASPVIQAGLLAAAGAGMAWHGTLDARGCSVLASLCFHLFTPALTFSTLAAAISLDSIRRLWPLLVNMTISSLLGLATGWALSLTLRVPAHFRPLVIVAVAFGNVGNLPLVFVSALCADTSAIFYKTLGSQCVSLGVAYTAFDICIATMFQFTLALYLLRPPPAVVPLSATEEGRGELEEVRIGIHDTATLHKDPTLSDLLAERRTRGGGTGTGSGTDSGGSSPVIIAPPHINNSTSNEIELVASPPPLVRAYTHAQNGEVEIAEEQEQDRLLHHHCHAVDTKANTSSVWTTIKQIEWWKIFPLPTQAAIGGAIIGCIPVLKSLLFGTGSGTTPAPLRSLSEALELLGQGLIPGAIPLLGAVLYRGPGLSQLPARVTVGVVLTRLLIQPALLTALALLLFWSGAYPAPALADPMFILTLLLANCTPTAINMQTLTVLYNHGAEEMSQILFYEYLASLLTLPFYIWIFLKVIDAFAG